MAVTSVKKAYSTPRLTEHGSVQRLTEGAGSQTIFDFFVYGFNDPFGVPGTGS
jgi:hypothetical protein